MLRTIKSGRDRYGLNADREMGGEKGATQTSVKEKQRKEGRKGGRGVLRERWAIGK